MISEALSHYSILDYADPQRISRVAQERIARNHHLRIESGGEHGSGFLRLVDLGGISIANLSFGSRVAIKGCTDDGHYYAQYVYRGSLGVENRGKYAIASKENIVIINPNTSVEFQFTEDCEKLVLRFRKDLLERALEEMIGRSITGNIDFNPCEPICAANASCLLRLIDFICGDLDSSGSIVKNKSSLDHMERLIASSLLTSVPNNFSELLQLGNSGVFIPSSMRRVEDWIHANLGEQIRLENLVEISGRSVKAVYQMFEKYHRTTPMAYVKDLRLKKAREELENRLSRYSTVADVAMSVGLVHFGNFAAEYQSRYHECPSKTLRKRMM
ncbi:MAG: AraC family transcriptional regulator [Thauera sp.]|jgi:AraC-like DNA-binding protein|nr:AraC family transcriptional regulator [Thauera sp.]